MDALAVIAGLAAVLVGPSLVYLFVLADRGRLSGETPPS
jgi:hypothetical protein